MNEPTELLPGTLELLVLKSLTLEARHGLGVARRIEQMTGGTFLVKPGSLFPALHRMEEQGWLKGEWGVSENGRKAKFYALTRTGKKQLSVATGLWERVALAMRNALEAE